MPWPIIILKNIITAPRQGSQLNKKGKAIFAIGHGGSYGCVRRRGSHICRPEFFNLSSTSRALELSRHTFRILRRYFIVRKRVQMSNS
jgi:hypothetical protein